MAETESRRMSHGHADTLDRLRLLAADQWAQLRRTRDVLDRSWACLATVRVRPGAGGDGRPPDDIDPDVAGSGTRPEGHGSFRVEGWMGLGNGSPEQDAAIAEAVREIVQLQYLLIEGIGRHFPALAPAIRDVAQHLLEYAPNLTDPNCCKGARAGALRRPDELRN